MNFGQGMNTLQSEFYQKLVVAAGLDDSSFQLLSPAISVASSEDLWQQQNQVPQNDLCCNFLVQTPSPFFTSYAALIDELEFPTSKFESDIGKSTYKAWNTYLKGMNPQPTPTMMPTVFRQWAMQNAPGKASIGASDLMAMVQINGAKQQLKPYQGKGSKAVDYSDNFKAASQLVDQGSSLSFSFKGPIAPQNVEANAYFGLWSESTADSIIAQKFSESDINVTFNISNWAAIGFSPGSWYNSGVFHQAYSASSGQIPWPKNPKYDWDYFFGDDGKLLNATGMLFAAKGIQYTINSKAVFSSDEQDRIRKNLFNGLWPFYIEGATSTISFSSTGTIVNCKTNNDDYFIFGRTVKSINDYLISA